jgi:hypothetical protein
MFVCTLFFSLRTVQRRGTLVATYLLFLSRANVRQRREVVSVSRDAPKEMM